MEKRLQNLTSEMNVLRVTDSSAGPKDFGHPRVRSRWCSIQADYDPVRPLSANISHAKTPACQAYMKFQCTTYGRPSHQALSLGNVCTFACAHLTNRANRNSSRRYRAMPCSDELWWYLYSESHREECAAGERLILWYWNESMWWHRDAQLVKTALAARAWVD